MAYIVLKILNVNFSVLTSRISDGSKELTTIENATDWPWYGGGMGPKRRYFLPVLEFIVEC